MKKCTKPKVKRKVSSFDVSKEAQKAWAKYKSDLSAKHSDATEYWRGQATAFETVANAMGKKVRKKK